MDSKDLINRFRGIVEALNTQIEEVREIERQKWVLDQKELDLRALEDRIEEQNKELVKKSEEFNQQKEYNEKASTKNAQWEQQLQLEAQRLKPIAQEKEELDRQREELKKKEAEAQETLSKAYEIKELQRQMEAEKAIDRKRKEILDLREKRIKAREQQLQIQSEI